jgi:ribosomal protein S18 acetylase RimI-like enzyme
MVAATGSPVAFFNEVIPVAADVDADALVDAVGVVEAARLPWMAHLRDGVDDELVDPLRRLGMVEDEDDYPAMALTKVQADIAAPPGVAVVRVGDAADFDVHLRTAAMIAGADVGHIGTWLGSGIVSEPSVALFTGYLDGAPVAISMSMRCGSVVGVYNVATARFARRRGVGWAMTAAAVAAGVESGADIAILQSTPMAVGVYSAHGFQRLFRYRLFRRP